MDAASGAEDAEARLGELLWQAVEGSTWDDAFSPTEENLRFMARAPFSYEALAGLLVRLLGPDVGVAHSLRWTPGLEGLLAAVLERPEGAERLEAAVAIRSSAAADVIRWCLARYGLRSHTSLPPTLLGRAAAWIAAPTADPDPRDPGRWWEGSARVWPDEAWWREVAETAADLGRPVTTSARLRPALPYAEPADRALILVRLFDGSPRWVVGQILEMGEDAWEPLLDLAERLQLDPEGRLAPLATGLAVTIVRLSRELGRELQPIFLGALVRGALEQNRHVEAVGPLNEALRMLPEDQRQRLMLEAPYLRWRHLPACALPTVVEWAIGEAASITPRAFATLQRNHPESAFHVGATIEDYRALAADALGGLGAEFAPALVEGLARAAEPNKATFVAALGGVRAPEAVGPLLTALTGGAVALRDVVQEGLAGFGESILPELEPLLRDPRRPVRAAAARVLARMESTEATRSLSSQLLMDEDAPEVRASLSAVVDAASRPPEVTALDVQEVRLGPSMRRSVIESLKATDGRSWVEHAELGPVLLSVMAGWIGELRGEGQPAPVDAWYDALSRFERDATAPWAAARLIDHPRFDPEWLAEAADVLGEALARPLVWRLRGASMDQRRAILRALARFTPQTAVREFLRGVVATDAELRRTCQEGIRSAGDAALPILRDALRSPEPALRQAVALLLERLPDPENVGPLRAALADTHDAGASWVLQRAIAVSQGDSNERDDRALDRALANQRAGAVPSFVVELGLPTLRYRSGVTMSSDARSWLLGGIAMAADKVDWFLPLSYSARLIWVLRLRLDDASCQRLLEELRRRSRGSNAPDGPPFLTVATALLATDAEIEALAGRIADPSWRGMVRDRKRVTFPDGDPQALFLRGTRASLRAVVDLAAWAPHPLLLAWSRDHLQRAADALGCTTDVLDAASRPAGAWTVEAARRELSRRADLREVTPTVRWMQDLRDPTFARLASAVILETVDAGGLSHGRLRWRAGAAVDARGEPVALSDQLRIARHDAMPDDELAAWEALLPPGSQPIAQLWPERRVARIGPRERTGTGWLTVSTFLGRLGVLGYALALPPGGVPGARRVFPPAPLGVATRPMDGGWGLSLAITPLEAWEVDERGAAVVKPERARVIAARIVRREDPRSAWREVARTAAPPALGATLDGDLDTLDEDAEPAVEEVVSEEAQLPALRGASAVVEEEPDAEARPRRRKEAPPPAPSTVGWLGRLFGRKDPVEEARKEHERRVAEARVRREESRRKAEEARRDEERQRQEATAARASRARSLSERWKAVEGLLPEARAAANLRQRNAADERRRRVRAGRAGGVEGNALLRRFLWDLDAVRRGDAPRVEEVAPPAPAPEPPQEVVSDFLEVEVSPVAAPAPRKPVVQSVSVEVPLPSADELLSEIQPAAAPARPTTDEAIARLLMERNQRVADARKQAQARMDAQRSRAEAAPRGEPTPPPVPVVEVAPVAAAVVIPAAVEVVVEAASSFDATAIEPDPVPESPAFLDVAPAPVVEPEVARGPVRPPELASVAVDRAEAARQRMEEARRRVAEKAMDGKARVAALRAVAEEAKRAPGLALGAWIAEQEEIAHQAAAAAEADLRTANAGAFLSLQTEVASGLPVDGVLRVGDDGVDGEVEEFDARATEGEALTGDHGSGGGEVDDGLLDLEPGGGATPALVASVPDEGSFAEGVPDDDNVQGFADPADGAADETQLHESGEASPEDAEVRSDEVDTTTDAAPIDSEIAGDDAASGWGTDISPDDGGLTPIVANEEPLEGPAVASAPTDVAWTPDDVPDMTLRADTPDDVMPAPSGFLSLDGDAADDGPTAGGGFLSLDDDGPSTDGGFLSLDDLADPPPVRSEPTFWEEPDEGAATWDGDEPSSTDGDTLLPDPPAADRFVEPEPGDDGPAPTFDDEAPVGSGLEPEVVAADADETAQAGASEAPWTDPAPTADADPTDVAPAETAPVAVDPTHDLPVFEDDPSATDDPGAVAWAPPEDSVSGESAADATSSRSEVAEATPLRAEAARTSSWERGWDRLPNGEADLPGLPDDGIEPLTTEEALLRAAEAAASAALAEEASDGVNLEALAADLMPSAWVEEEATERLTILDFETADDEDDGDEPTQMLTRSGQLSPARMLREAVTRSPTSAFLHDPEEDTDPGAHDWREPGDGEATQVIRVGELPIGALEVLDEPVAAWDDSITAEFTGIFGEAERTRRNDAIWVERTEVDIEPIPADDEEDGGTFQAVDPSIEAGPPTPKAAEPAADTALGRLARWFGVKR